jgi:hypothetical protein
MNYITRLRSENEEKRNRINRMRFIIQEFRIHLASDKFQSDNDSERRDWISTSDVKNWLDKIETE